MSETFTFLKHSTGPVIQPEEGRDFSIVDCDFTSTMLYCRSEKLEIATKPEGLHYFAALNEPVKSLLKLLNGKSIK